MKLDDELKWTEFIKNTDIKLPSKILLIAW